MKKTLQKYLCGLCASAFMIGAFTIQANAQTDIPIKWERTSRTGAAAVAPSWFATGIKGIAYHNNRVYVADRINSTIRTVDAITGEDITLDTPFDLTGVGGAYPLYDIETSTDGAIFVGSMTLDGDGTHAYKVYIWESEGGTYDKVLEVANDGRIGDKLSVVGSLADNTVEVWSIAANLSPAVVNVSTTSDQGTTWSTRTITLSGGATWVINGVGNMNVTPLGLGGSSNFVVSGHNGYTPRIFNNEGVATSYFGTSAASGSGVTAFKIDGVDYVAYYAVKSNGSDNIGNIQVYNLSTKALVADTEIMGDASSGNSLYGDVAVRVNSDGSYDVFAVDPYNGIAGYSHSEYVTISGSAGWRLLSSPTSDNSYDDLLGDIWTQGIATGADATTGEASVKTFNGSSFVTVDDLTATMPTGVGFATYIYSDDDYDNSEADAGFPKVLSVAGTANAGSIVPTITTGADAYTLVGNPYNSTIDSDSFTRVQVNPTVWVYDSSLPAYISWNGTTGTLTDGLIAPFQGFWVQNDAVGAAPVLTIKEADKTTGGTLHKAEPTPVLSFRIDSETQRSHAYFSFTSEGQMGDDNMDAAKLTPLDFVNYISIASESDGRLLDINNLPRELENEIEIPISISAMKVEGINWVERAEDMTITWPTLDNIPSDWEIEFVDYQEQIRLDVRTDESYSFTSNSGLKQEKKGSMFEAITPQKQKASSGNRFALVVRPAVAASNEAKELPSTFTLEQNYPNPFNPTTTVNYSISKSGLVSLKIYNTMGQEVASLVNEVQNAGSHSITWNAQNLSSGMYFYRLSTGGQTLTRQMTLIK